MSRSLRRTVLAALAVALAAPAGASAAAPWSTPAPIRYGSTSPVLQGRVALTTNASGLGVAVADSGAGAGVAPSTRASVFTNGVFLDPFDLTTGAASVGPDSGGVAAYGSTRLIAAGLLHGRDTTQAMVAFGRLTPNRASLEAPRPLGPAGLVAHHAALAVNARGDAAIAFPVCRDAGCQRILTYLAVRRAGTSTFHSVRLADGSGPLGQVAVAVDARGDAVAVWAQGSTLYARIRTAGGRLRDRQRVGLTARGAQLRPSVALSTHRGELIGWTAQSISEGDGSAAKAWVAQARDGGTFTANLLDDLPVAGSGRSVSEAGVRVAYAARGRSLLAWTAFDGDATSGRWSVRTAELQGAANDPAQHLVDPVTVSDPAMDTVLSSMLVGPTGGQELTMLTGVQGGGSYAPAGVGVRAASRAPGATGAFTAEEIAPAATGAAQPFTSDAALLSDGRTIAAWQTVGQGDLSSLRSTPVP
jgi:hypothetical protein